MEENKVKYRQPSVTRGLILAAISLILTIASISLVTFALFVKTENQNESKIKAGELDIGLYLQNVKGTVIDDDDTTTTYGKLIAHDVEYVTDDNPNGLDISNEEDSVFVVDNAVPTQYQKAKFFIENNGTIAATFEIRITDLEYGVYDAANDTYTVDPDGADEALASQIKITMTCIDANGAIVNNENGDPVNVTFMLNQVGNADDPAPSLIIPAVALGEDVYFTVNWEFVDDENNNAAMSGAVNFDIVVIATQDT